MSVFTKEADHAIHSIFLSRKRLYELLYLMFQEPAVNVLDQIRKLSNSPEFEELHEGGQIIRSFSSHLTEKQIIDVQEEYRMLFIGPGPLGAPPWESYYRSKERLVFEEWTHQVKEEYQKYGFYSIYENKEPDDHLLPELGFMIYLSGACLHENSSQKLNTLISSQIDFLKQHLTIWVPYFCERIIEHTNSRFYLGTAMLLEDFITFDLESLYEITEDLKMSKETYFRKNALHKDAKI